MSHEANKEAHCCQHHDEKHHKHHEQKFTNEKSLKNREVANFI